MIKIQNIVVKYLHTSIFKNKKYGTENNAKYFCGLFKLFLEFSVEVSRSIILENHKTGKIN
jgi:hypothetical protein